MIRILLADDHPVVRAGLRALLDDEDLLEVCGEAATSSEAVELVQNTSADVLVLDLNMPGRGGLDTLREVGRLQPDLPVLVLSRHEEDPYAVRAIRAGAAGYLHKASVSDRLVGAIRAVAAGERFISDSVAEVLATHVAAPDEKEPLQTLSDREMQVLRLIGQGNTPTDIADELSLSVKTISTYRSRILDKLQLENTAQLIRYAIENDLV